MSRRISLTLQIYVQFLTSGVPPLRAGHDGPHPPGHALVDGNAIEHLAVSRWVPAQLLIDGLQLALLIPDDSRSRAEAP